MPDSRKNIAVIGGGIAGILSAYLLSKKHKVTLYEKNDYLGGHTNTLKLEENGRELSVDTGFIVLNDRTYPTLHAFLKEIAVPVRFANMSFGYWCKESGLQYSGDTLFSLFAQAQNLFNPKFLSMLIGLQKFNAQARRDLASGKLAGITLREYLRETKTSPYLAKHYIIPMAASIWSSPDEGIEEFPAESLLRFFSHHGLLTLSDRPRWQTVVGGSFAYVKKFQEIFTGKILLSSPVQSVERLPGSVRIHCQSSTAQAAMHSSAQDFDAVVLASHADETRKILSDPSEDESRLLAPWQYQLNETYLHTDRLHLPPNRKAWSSWNYIREKNSQDKHPVSITYHMNKLQGFSAAKEYCVTLNPKSPIRESEIVKMIPYLHPVFTSEAVATQKNLQFLQGKRNTYFAGSYFGWGFHEDAALSAARVAEHFGIGFES